VNGRSRQIPRAEEAKQAEALVEAARSGNRQAFDALVRRYRSRVFALGLHLSGSAAEADDITQDVFVQAFGRIRQFEGRSQFFTWLYRITLNRALNARRAERRRRSVDLDDDRVRAALEVDAGGDPRLELELRESYGLLVAALDQLSPLLRSTVVLVALQGLSHREAAIVLDTTEGTVAWRMHEGRARLVKSIEALSREPTEALSREPTPLPVHKRLLSAEQLLARLALVTTKV
jgi:RNA polymerase sigma-70 factor (ECF subfamily)